MKNIFKRTPKTVDGVMSVFHKTIAELENVFDHHSKLAEDTRAEMQRLEVKADEAANEAARAVVSINKLKSLFE